MTTPFQIGRALSYLYTVPLIITIKKTGTDAPVFTISLVEPINAERNERSRRNSFPL